MNTADMKKKVLDFIREQHMVEEGDGVLAAVSGGADSVCLLFLLCSMREELAVRLAAFHLHHGLRGAEADRDEAFVKQLCGAWQIPFYSAHEDAAAYGRERGISEEEAGRELRYSHLEALADRLSFGKIAVAHHREDQAETVVFHLFRGTGLKGMGGIRPVRGKIIRPLLECSRQEIEGYLRENGISWCEDSTNSENTYKRNRIRNELLPWAGQYLNERASEHAAQFARFAAQADAYFEAQAEMILEAENRTDPEELLEAEGRTETENRTETESRTAAVSVRTFDSQPEILKGYLVRAMIRQAGGSARNLTERHIQAVCALTGPGGGVRADLPGGLQAVRGYRELRIARPERLEESGILEQLGKQLQFRVYPREKQLEIPKNQCTKWFDYDRIKGTLSVRTRKEGDYFLLRGGGKKLLRRYLIDEKIPEAERDKLLLLTEGSHVLWVIGYRISEYYKVSETTEKILEVSVCKGEKDG